MSEGRFTIVFERLSEAIHEQGPSGPYITGVQVLKKEADEVAELCRLVATLNEPPPMSYTTT